MSGSTTRRGDKRILFGTAFVEPKGSLAYNQSIESTLRPDVCLPSDAGYTIKMVGVSFRVLQLSLSPFPQKSMPPGESSSKSEIMPRCMKSSSTPGDCMCDWCQPGGAPIFAFGGVDIPGGGGPAGTGGGMPGGGGGACLPGGAPGGGGGGIPGGGPRLAHDDDGARKESESVARGIP